MYVDPQSTNITLDLVHDLVQGDLQSQWVVNGIWTDPISSVQLSDNLVGLFSSDLCLGDPSLILSMGQRGLSEFVAGQPLIVHSTQFTLLDQGSSGEAPINITSPSSDSPFYLNPAQNIMPLLVSPLPDVFNSFSEPTLPTSLKPINLEDSTVFHLPTQIDTGTM